MAKLGYTHMANFCKNISFQLLKNRTKYIWRTNLHFDMTHSKNERRIQSHLAHISKCPKSGCNRWNMLNIIHIYAKRCEIMQKKSMKTLKRPNSLFLHCEISSVVLKTRKIRKTRQTKTRITQNFHILYPIQGGTMWKLTSQGFRKCGTFWV